MPPQFQGLDMECGRKGRFGRIRFILQDVIGMAIGGSEEIFRIRYVKVFCEFEATGVCTMGFLTLIFKTLIPDWHMTIEPKVTRDVTNVTELSTLTTWDPDQDLFPGSREIVSSVRIVEERGRGTFVKKDRDFQHILDHQAELQREIKLVIGLRDEDGVVELWFEVPVLSAASMREHEEHLVGQIV
jgi:hypothetical protein